jgi:hypothetical protein
MVNGFNFIRVDSFMDDINREDCFDTRDMDGVSPNYKFVLASSCPSDINDCLDEDGTLNENVNILQSIGVDDGVCSLLWSKGINGERTLSVADSTVTYSFSEDIQLQGVFLVNIANGSGYVLAYSISDKQITIVDNELICPCDGMIWTIKYGD